jgi:myo-inositol catabolism protein IolS
MEYRRLSKTGLPVSVIGVGTWQHDVDQLLGRAGELGVNLVDTDECYGDHLAEAYRVEGSLPCKRSRSVRRIRCDG